MMPDERRYEKFEDDRQNWEIHFDLESESHQRGERTVLVSFISNDDEKRFLTEKDIENLKQDLKNLGKLRIINEGRKFLEK